MRAIRGLVALTALEMDWTEDDTVKTSRLSDSSLILTSQFRVWSSYTHAAINSNGKYV